MELKNQGNAKYKEQKFHEAIDAYSSTSLTDLLSLFSWWLSLQRRLKHAHRSQQKSSLNSIKIERLLGNHWLVFASNCLSSCHRFSIRRWITRKWSKIVREPLNWIRNIPSVFNVELARQRTWATLNWLWKVGFSEHLSRQQECSTALGTDLYSS